MARRKRGFKVIARHRGKLMSWMYYWADIEGVEYKVGEAVSPRPSCGPLCVTSHIEDARYLLTDPADRIYRCSYVEDKRREVWTALRRPRPLQDLPCHTVLASNVKLLGKPIT